MKTPTNTPPAWPFPPLDPIQARNHQKAHDAVVRIEQQKRQQRLRECAEAARESK